MTDWKERYLDRGVVEKEKKLFVGSTYLISNLTEWAHSRWGNYL